MPQASERSLATPMMSPCFPAIRPICSSPLPLAASYTKRWRGQGDRWASPRAGIDLAAVNPPDVVEQGPARRRVGQALAGEMPGQRPEAGGQLADLEQRVQPV